MINNLISSSTAFLPFIFIINFILEKDILFLKGLIMIFVTDFISEFLKYKVFFMNKRPMGAKDCNLWNNDGNQEEKPGMPSSHASFTTFFILFYIYVNTFYYKNKITNWKNVILVLYWFLVLNSRYQKKCHSIEQLSAGTLLGTLIFSIFYICQRPSLV